MMRVMHNWARNAGRNVYFEVFDAIRISLSWLKMKACRF